MHFEPYIPVIEGMTGFEGGIMHSCDYRDPEDFRGKRVAVVGGSTSGVDIAMDLVESVDKSNSIVSTHSHLTVQILFS